MGQRALCIDNLKTESKSGMELLKGYCHQVMCLDVSKCIRANHYIPITKHPLEQLELKRQSWDCNIQHGDYS